MTKFKNLLGMEYYQFFSGSPKRRLEYTNQMAAETADAHDFMSTSSEWVGIVLSGESGGSSTDRNESYYPNEFQLVDLGDGIPRISMKIRIFDRQAYDLGLLDPSLILADPFEKGIPMNEKQWRISLHPDAYTLYNGFEEASFNFGDRVSLREQGGVFYVTQNMTNPWAGASSNTGGRDFGLPFDYQLTDSYTVTNPKSIKSKCKFELEDFLEFYNLGIFAELFAHIAKHESGSGKRFGGNVYDVYNYGPINKKYPPASKGMLAGGNIELTSMTIAQVMQAQKRGSKSVKYGDNKYSKVHATGKYQIIADTLIGITKGIPNLNTGTLYSKEVQEAFGIYLLLNKRPYLGGYLMGDPNKKVNRAQVDVALEWASKRVYTSFRFRWKGEVLINGQKVFKRFTQVCPRFCMCYGKFGNQFGYSGGNPTCRMSKTKKDSAQYDAKDQRESIELNNILKRVRQKFDTDPRCIQIRNARCAK